MKKIIVFVTVFALALGLVACAAQKAEWQSHLDLGQKYLLDGNYEQAIVEFNRVIEIDPKNVEAYIGLADAYAALGDYESAIEALERGIAETDSDELRAKLEEIRALAEAAASADGEGQGETGTGGDEDRGEPETTGQEEQTEQEETPEVPMPPQAPDTVFSSSVPSSFDIKIPSSETNNTILLSYTINGHWLGAFEKHYNEMGYVDSVSQLIHDNAQSGTMYEKKSYTFKVTKTDNSSEYVYPEDVNPDFSTKYDPEREVWTEKVLNEDLSAVVIDSEINKDGQLIKSVYNGGEGGVVQTSEFTYDSSGKLSLQNCTTEADNYLSQRILTYFYDSQDRIIKINDENTFREYTQTEVYYYEYDSAGNLISATHNVHDSSSPWEPALSRIVLEYNSDGFPIKETEYSPTRTTVNSDGSFETEWTVITSIDYVY